MMAKHILSRQVFFRIDPYRFTCREGEYLNMGFETASASSLHPLTGEESTNGAGCCPEPSAVLKVVREIHVRNCA